MDKARSNHLLLAMIFCTSAVSASSAEPPPSPSATDYLVQEVCVDQKGALVFIDPIRCPHADSLRALQVGEPLPYHKHDQPDSVHPEGYQQHDSYPARDLAGDELVVNPFVIDPFDRYVPYGDGYDIYRVSDGWVSASETRDGGGFSTTFFGANCELGNGWVFFPASMKGSPEPGRAEMPIHGDRWEANGEAWPGVCPANYQTNGLTTWAFVKAYPFGGIGGSPVKRLDAIRSIHGFSTNPQFLQRGHLEVFYFTQLYGVTRWEVWTANEQVAGDDQQQEQAASVGKRCNGTGSENYEGHEFVVTACRDWSAVTVSPSASPPVIRPVPDMNLLRNFHFADDLANWSHTGSLKISLRNSDLPRDKRATQSGGQGVRYLVVGCTGSCSGEEAIYQDVPISAKVTSGLYMFGVTARLEGKGSGTLRISLAQLDASGHVLNQKDLSATAEPSNERFTADQSVVLSSGFLSTTNPIVVDAKARAFRFSVNPLTAGSFDVIDTWLMKGSY